MSGGKKKSGFQITSVTLDYGQGSAEPSPQKQSFSGDSSASSLQQASEVINGVQSMTHSASLTPRQPGHGPSTTPGRVGGDVAEGAGESGDYRTSPGSGSVVVSGGEEVSAVMALVTNGPVRFTPPRTIIQHASSSQPSTPMSVRKQHSQEQSPQSSRFRVVRLGQGLGEPYKRGRWTCVDYLEREGGEERGLRRVMDSMRHAHSLESLETAGLGGPEGGGAGAALKPLGHLRTLKPGHVVHSQGTTHLRAPRIGGDGGLPSKPSSEEQDDGDSQAEHAAAKPQTLSSGPPSPSHKDRFNVRLVDSSNPPLSHFPGAPLPQHPQDSPLRSPPRYMGEPSPRLRHIPPPLCLDMEAAGKPVFRETQSQPSSPGPPLSRDGVFHHSMNPIQTPSAFSLPKSMFGGPFDPDDESGSGNSMIAIDNKIEQAMDLVKTHLMMAVREEVEVLREQIKELAERNAQLERENYILRALRERD